MHYQNVPILAFTTPILPGGRVVIRIINEDEHALMQACCQCQGLGLMLSGKTANDNHKRIFAIGTFAQLLDFYLGENGLLHLVFEAKQRIQLLNIHYNKNLRTADILYLPPWPEQALEQTEAILAQRLREIYQRCPELNLLYTQAKFDDSAWVCQRWLEIIQIPTLEKYRLLAKPSCEAAKAFLTAYVR